MQHQSRPVNLALTTIKFPLAAIASILHRLSGVLIFLFIPCVLHCLGKSLHSASEFAALQMTFQEPLNRLLLWIFLSGFIYHFWAGIRHLLMDLGVGETLAGGRWGALLVLLISAILIIRVGIYLW